MGVLVLSSLLFHECHGASYLRQRNLDDECTISIVNGENSLYHIQSSPVTCPSKDMIVSDVMDYMIVNSGLVLDADKISWNSSDRELTTQGCLTLDATDTVVFTEMMMSEWEYADTPPSLSVTAANTVNFQPGTNFFNIYGFSVQAPTVELNSGFWLKSQNDGIAEILFGHSFYFDKDATMNSESASDGSAAAILIRDLGQPATAQLDGTMSGDTLSIMGESTDITISSSAVLSSLTSFSIRGNTIFMDSPNVVSEDEYGGILIEATDSLTFGTNSVVRVTQSDANIQISASSLVIDSGARFEGVCGGSGRVVFPDKPPQQFTNCQ